MTLKRPALALGTGPRGVQDARRWVASTIADLGRADLVETAAVGVSELVTNALLHGEPPIQVTIRGTREHPRVEVRDASPERPVLPHPADSDDLDDLLLTFGRGLGIVARASAAWGADLEEDGKVVWFTPAAGLSDEISEGLFTGEDAVDSAAEDHDLVEIDLPGVPVAAYLAFQRHTRELRREVRLLALAHDTDYPQARPMSDLFSSLERVLRHDLGATQVDAARAAGAETVDLRLVLRDEDAPQLARLSELLDLADDFCRDERLLSVARSPEHQDFQRWFLREVVRRGAGEPPLAWEPGDRSPGSRSIVS